VDRYLAEGRFKRLAVRFPRLTRVVLGTRVQT
jgi:hypothetical protein